ncbi:MAG: protein kinase, partial [Verrucomicrobiales bacterium]|nr:protein kinase [Verrucomicrobiales bacterium]
MNDLDLQATQQNYTPGSTLFGRYMLTRLIARGKRGDLWEAQDQRLQLDVAIKLLVGYPHQAAVTRGGARAMDLTHPNIVRTYDVLEEENLVAVVTELVKGKSLAEWLRGKSPSWCEAGEAKRWAEDLFSALDFAWGQGRQVHGDVRLANLLIGPNNALKISDFPFAGVREGKNLLELNAEVTAGVSLPNLSPQIIAGESATHADDLYAAAASIYELLTGKPVFPGGNVIAQIERKVPPTVAVRRAELEIQGSPMPEAWEQWIAQCLAKDRSARPANAGEVLPLIQQVDTVALPPVPQTASATAGSKLRTAVKAIEPKSGWRAVLTSPTGRAATLALVGLLGYQFGIRGPNQAALSERRERVIALSADDDQVPKDPAASGLASDWEPVVMASKNRQTEWSQFVEELELEPLAFTTEDERLLLEVRRKANAWQTRYSESEDKQSKLSSAEGNKVGELKTAILKCERDERDLQTDVERLDLWKRLLDASQDERLAALPEYKTGLDKVSKKVAALQASIDRAEKDDKMAKDAEEKKTKEMAEAAAKAADAWLASAQERFANARTFSAQETVGASAKIEHWKTYLATLDAPAESVDPARVVELKGNAEAELKLWLEKASEETPTEPLKVAEIFAASTLFKDLSENEKRAALKKAQVALATAGTYKGKPDGDPGPGTHSA